jgi:FtsZ-binding cell division protein ZapB
MTSRAEPKGDEHEFPVAFAEQLYDMLRCMAGMGPKTIPELFETRGIEMESVSRSSVASLELERQSPRREYISLLPSKFFHHDQDRSLFATCHPELPLFREQPEHECYPDGGVALQSANRPTMTLAGLQDHVATLEGVIKGTDKKLEDVKQELKKLRGQKEDLQSKNTQLAKKSSELQDKLQKLGRQRTI